MLFSALKLSFTCIKLTNIEAINILVLHRKSVIHKKRCSVTKIASSSNIVIHITLSNSCLTKNNAWTLQRSPNSDFFFFSHQNLGRLILTCVDVASDWQCRLPCSSGTKTSSAGRNNWVPPANTWWQHGLSAGPT